MSGHRRSQMIITDPQPTEESTTGGGGGVAANDESSDAEFSSIVAPKLLIALLREKERCALESLLTFARPTSTVAPPPPQQDPSSIASAKKRAAALIKSISRHARENRPIPIAPNSSAAGASPQLLYFPNAYVEALIVHLCPDCHKLAAEADASRQSRNKKKRRRHPSVSASSSSLSDSGSGGDDDGSSSASSSSASSSSNTAKRVLKERRRLLKAKERRKRQRDGSDNGDSGSDSDDSAGRKRVIEEKTLEHARRENALRCAAHKRSIAESLPQCNDHVHPLPTPLFLQAEGGLSMLPPSHVVWHEIKEARKMLGDVASFANEVFEEIAPAHNAPTSPPRRKGRRGEYPHHNAATPPPLSGENQLQQSDDGNAKHASLLEDVSDLFGENNSLATDLVATSLSGHARGMPVLEDSSVHMYLEVLSERLKLLAESGAINASVLLRSPTQSDFTSLDGTFLNCAPLLSSAIRLLCKRSAHSPSDTQTRAKRKVAASSFEETPMTLHHESLLLSFLATRFLNQGHTSSAPSTIGRKSEELLGSSVAAQICFAIRARLRRSWVSTPSSRYHSHQHLIVSCETSLITIFLSLFESFLRFCEHEVAVLVASEVKWDHFSHETACGKKEPTAHFIWRTTDTIMSQLPVLSAMSVIFSNFIVAHSDGMASAARQCAKHVISFLDGMMTDAASSAILAALLTFWSPTAPSGDHCDKEDGREQDLLLPHGSSKEGSKETADHSVEAFNHDSIPVTGALLPRFFYLLEGIELDRNESTTLDEQTCKDMPEHTEMLRILAARMGNILGSKSTFRAALLNKATAKTISASGRDADGTKRDTKANKMNGNPEEQYDWVLEQHDKHENHYFRDEHRTNSLDVAMLHSYRIAVPAPTLGANAASALDIKSAARELYESKKNLTQARERCTHLRVQLQQQLESVMALIHDLGDAAQSATNAEQTFVAATQRIATQECISCETAMRMKALQATFIKSKDGTHRTKKHARNRK